MKSNALNYGRRIIIDWLSQILGPDYKSPFSILDIGMGPGDDLKNMRTSFPSKAFSLFGIDCLDHNVELAFKESIKAYKLNIESHPFPLGDASVDLVIANQVVEHTKEIFWIFSEISRVLKPNGYLIVGVPNLASLHNRLLLLFGQQPTCIEILGPHVRGITKPSFMRFIESGEYFSFVSWKGSNMYPFPKCLSGILCRIFPGFSASIFFLIRRTQKSGNFREVLSRHNFETPFL
jgi:ubiquinone/menaquinone biosynthesis C-methylase UbiE